MATSNLLPAVVFQSGGMEQVVNDTEWIAIGRVTVDGGGMIMWVGDLSQQAEVIEYQQLRPFGQSKQLKCLAKKVRIG